MRELFIYSDGGSVNNGGKDPNKPVWGAYSTLIVNKNQQVIKKFENIYENVTNNQMELLGGMIGLRFMTQYMTKHCPNEKIKLHIYSDSQYYIKGCSEWLAGWKKKGWRNSSKKIIENLEMWKEIDQLIHNPQFEIDFNWVRGHAGKTKVSLDKDPHQFFNEMCDTELSKLLDEKRS